MCQITITSPLVPCISNLLSSSIISSLWSCEAPKIHDYVPRLFATTQGSNWTMCMHNLLNEIYILDIVSFVVTWTLYKASPTLVNSSPELSQRTWTFTTHHKFEVGMLQMKIRLQKSLLSTCGSLLQTQ